MQIKLTWDASTEKDFDRYYVHRKCNGENPEWVRIHECFAPKAILEVPRGAEVSFCVTSVDISGNESGYSESYRFDEVPPEPPTHLVGSVFVPHGAKLDEMPD